MHAEVSNISPTKVKIVIKAISEDLLPFKNKVLTNLSKSVKLAGFRAGKAPLNLVEKNVDPAVLQREFLDEAMSSLYSRAAASEKIRPVGQPEVNVKKFVPFTTLEFEITTDVVGKIKLADYKKIKQAKPKPDVTSKDVNDVLESLKLRVAEKSEANRAAKATDEVIIDFKGADEKGQPVSGAEGKDYPLVLGSNTFIPGFEDNLIGLKPGEQKTFKLTFPKDYGVKALANRKVEFSVTIKKVNEVVTPKLDDSFAPKVGPFKTLKDLKDDIKKQLATEKQNEINRNFANELIEKISDKSTAAIPESMLEHQIEHNLEDLKEEPGLSEADFPGIFGTGRNNRRKISR